MTREKAEFAKRDGLKVCYGKPGAEGYCEGRIREVRKHRGAMVAWDDDSSTFIALRDLHLVKRPE